MNHKWRHQEFSFGELMVWGQKSLVASIQGQSLGRGQKLKQFAGIAYKRSKFENFVQFSSWLVTSTFHGRGLSNILRGLAAQAHAWRRHYQPLWHLSNTSSEQRRSTQQPTCSKTLTDFTWPQRTAWCSAVRPVYNSKPIIELSEKYK